MKYILVTLLTLNISFANSISGVVTLEGKAPNGVLFIFAKKYQGIMPMPLAVRRIEKPSFPVKFNLSQADAMMKQIPFEGPFTVTARLSPSGSAMDKSGIEVSTTQKIEMGQKNIKLTLKNN